MRNIPLLRITFFSGFMLLLLVGGLFVGMFFTGGRGGEEGKANTFHRLLREYDFRSRQLFETESISVQRREFERFHNDLDRLEKESEGVENWLSVLKRRRQLAQIDSRYEQFYRQASRRASLAFPYSEPIAAIAAAAQVHNAAITREGEARLRDALPLLAGHRFASLRLSLHVLLGDFNNPEKAAASLPRNFIAPEYSDASSLEAESIFPDLVILKILAGDILSAAVDIQSALNAAPSSPLIRLAAEYYYDFGNLLRSAELFSQLPDEAALSRQADALWLAGYTDNARTIWAMQTSVRALYNLALTAPTLEEETALFERLVSLGGGGASGSGALESDDAVRYGLIHLTRLMDARRAVAALNAAPKDTLVEIELLKRRTEVEEMPRMIAETWLLLDRAADPEKVYQWGAWYFDLQRQYPETAKLLQLAKRQHNLSGPWMDLHEALHLMREGYLEAAEKILVSADHWSAAANRGRILESYRAPVRALEQYEKAITLLLDSNPDTAQYNTASRIQLRIAYCLKSLGRTEETRNALEYALDLNPDNLTARFELERLN
jgi:tetratricopeptide (TPR) repeat protein